MRPNFRVTGDAGHSTEARVAAFKAAQNNGAGAKGFAQIGVELRNFSPREPEARQLRGGSSC